MSLALCDNTAARSDALSKYEQENAVDDLQTVAAIKQSTLEAASGRSRFKSQPQRLNILVNADW